MPSLSPSSQPVLAAEPVTRLEWSRYQDNLPRHLIGLARDLETSLMRTLSEEKGFRGLRPSFAPLLALLAPASPSQGTARSPSKSASRRAASRLEAGRPLGALARELAISKQACSQLASLIEAEGYLERRPNPLDGRSKVLVLTARGTALVAEARRVLRTKEEVYAEVLGRSLYGRWIEALNAVFSVMRISKPAPAKATAAVLPLIVDRLQQQVMEVTMAKGHPGLKRSYAPILLLIGPDGGRVAEMARLQAISRQAISAVSLEIESLGYLRRVPDPLDGRSVVLELTPAGQTLIADSVETVTGIEAALERSLGGPCYAALVRASSALYHALELEASVFHRTDRNEE